MTNPKSFHEMLAEDVAEIERLGLDKADDEKLAALQAASRSRITGQLTDAQTEKRLLSVAEKAAALVPPSTIKHLKESPAAAQEMKEIIQGQLNEAHYEHLVANAIEFVTEKKATDPVALEKIKTDLGEHPEIFYTLKCEPLEAYLKQLGAPEKSATTVLETLYTEILPNELAQIHFWTPIS